MIHRLQSFRAENITGSQTYELRINSTATIIVGPNGTGKSTFLNLFYLFLTRQWKRLLEYNFSRLTLTLDQGEISLERSDLISTDPDALRNIPMSLRKGVSQLQANGLIGQFLLEPRNYTYREEQAFASTLGVTVNDLSSVQRYLLKSLKDSLSGPVLEIEQRLAEVGPEKLLYLPTYRRIEKDLKSILPDIEERVRSRTSDLSAFARQGQTFAEIVSFGMEDVARMLNDFTAKLNNIAKTKSNAAAQEYIRDMVRGRIKDYSIGPIRDTETTVIAEFVDRLDNQLLSLDDKAKLQSDIEKLRKRTVGKPSKDMQYLAFFVEKMLQVYLDLEREEAPLVQFTTVVQKYFTNKAVNYNNYTFSINDLKGNEIGLNDLSSGEKQILSVFAYLLLTPEPSYFVFIDEPELSLSVPWQKTFLPDILDTAKCKYLLAVSHSPFVFDNELRNAIVDVRKLQVN